MKDNVLRIKLVDSFDGITGHVVKFRGKWEYMFSEEPKSLSSCPGMLASCWWKCPSLTIPRITNSECQHWINCYGRGFGPRHSVNSVGMNVYTDDEGILSHRPHPDIFTDEKDIPLHQYRNNNFEFPLVRSLLEKRLHMLTKKAQEKSQAIHPEMAQLMDGCCTKRIITSGTSRRLFGKTRNQFGPTYFYSFSNEGHVDDSDLMRLDVIQDFLTRADTDYKRRILGFPKVCLPTTCAYQFNWESRWMEKENSFVQYFVMDGLGLAMPLEDGIAHHFMASLFAHNTSVGVLTFEDGEMSIGSDDPEILVFAWGRSGGSRNARARREAREGSASRVGSLEADEESVPLEQSNPVADDFDDDKKPRAVDVALADSDDGGDKNPRAVDDTIVLLDSASDEEVIALPDRSRVASREEMQSVRADDNTRPTVPTITRRGRRRRQLKLSSEKFEESRKKKK